MFTTVNLIALKNHDLSPIFQQKKTWVVLVGDAALVLVLALIAGGIHFSGVGNIGDIGRYIAGGGVFLIVLGDITTLALRSCRRKTRLTSMEEASNTEVLPAIKEGEKTDKQMDSLGKNPGSASSEPKRATKQDAKEIGLDKPKKDPSDKKTHEKVKQIKSQQLPEISQEVARLKKIFPDETTKLRLLLSEDYHFKGKEELAQFIFGRALEIKKAIQETHYVFLHGQTTQLFPLTYLTDALVSQCQKDKKTSGYHYLRFPESAPAENIIILDDHKNRSELLSVDAYLYNNDEDESSFSFILKNRSVCVDIPEHISNILKALNPKFNFDDPNYANLLQQIEKLCSSLEKEPIGVLYLICIPKETKMKDALGEPLGFPSHPLGEKCICYDKDQLEILEELQNDQPKICAHTMYSSKHIFHRQLQYRLFAKKLTIDTKAKIYIVTRLDETKKKQIKKDVSKIAKDLYKIASSKN